MTAKQDEHLDTGNLEPFEIDELLLPPEIIEMVCLLGNVKNVTFEEIIITGVKNLLSEENINDFSEHFKLDLKNKCDAIKNISDSTMSILNDKVDKKNKDHREFMDRYFESRDQEIELQRNK